MTCCESMVAAMNSLRLILPPPSVSTSWKACSASSAVKPIWAISGFCLTNFLSSSRLMKPSPSKSALLKFFSNSLTFFGGRFVATIFIRNFLKCVSFLSEAKFAKISLSRGSFEILSLFFSMSHLSFRRASAVGRSAAFLESMELISVCASLLTFFMLVLTLASSSMTPLATFTANLPMKGGWPVSRKKRIAPTDQMSLGADFFVLSSGSSGIILKPLRASGCDFWSSYQGLRSSGARKLKEALFAFVISSCFTKSMSPTSVTMIPPAGWTKMFLGTNDP
mmetsp:Transcript_148574/g.276747  ORF Transcript_148574/g.276747 Transcript_148574/m.276747 type:complete len:280 (-) Transcript_148574:31-870(-)